MVKDLRKQLSSLRKRKDCRNCVTSQSAVLQDVSKLSTEGQNCPAGLSSACERSGPHLLDAASDPVHKDDLMHGETEMWSSKVERPSQAVQSISPKVTEGSLKGNLPEKRICDTLLTLDATTQLMATWERLKILTLQHSKATEELRLLKVSYESCVQKLQDTHHKLSQERTNCLKLEAAEKRLSSELMAAKHLEPLLQQVRQQNLQLEIENAELVASALNVPRTSFSALTSLRQQLVEELKQRKMAEAEASNVSTQLEDCKQDLARLAAVEAKWEFLKSELEVAKAALRKANKKIKELQDLNKRLHDETNMKGNSCLHMDSNYSVSSPNGASCEEEKNTCLHQESEPEKGRAVEDNNMPPIQDENL